MSILNVNKINPVGGGSTITIAGIASVTGNVTATAFVGDGSNLTGISVDSTKIETGNTKVETIDTGSDGHIKVTTEGTERIRINEHGLSIKNSTNTSA